MTAIKTNKAVFQYIVFALTGSALVLEMTSFCATGWLRYEGTTGSNTDHEVDHLTRSRRDVNPYARVPDCRKTSTFKPPPAYKNPPNPNMDPQDMAGGGNQGAGSGASGRQGYSSSGGGKDPNNRPRPNNFPNTRSPPVSRITSSSLTKRPFLSNWLARDPSLPGRPTPPNNDGTSRSPSTGQGGDPRKSSLKPKSNGGKFSRRPPLFSRRPEIVPSLDPGSNTLTKRPPLNWKPSSSDIIEMSTRGSSQTNEGQVRVGQRVMIDIGLWAVRVRVCEKWIAEEGYSCKRTDKLNSVKEGDISLTEVRIEAVFAIIFGVVGCISTALTRVPLCLKRRQILLILAICGLILSGLLYFITIARVVSLNPKIKDIANREYSDLQVKIPWCLVVGGIGAGLAFVSSGLLATGKWLDKQKAWSELSDQVEFTKEPSYPQN